jgi:quercetin dioxygenase-like cupin family protein
MHVTSTQGLTVELLVGPEHGAGKIYIWAVAAPAGQAVGMHYHGGEEILRVLYGRLHVRVGDKTRELTTGEILIVPPGTHHGYRALENSELEVYGEIGAGEFLVFRDGNGERVEEIFMAGAPWSREPGDPSAYRAHEDLMARYAESLAGYPLEVDRA